MKTTLMVLVLASVALVSCGKKDSKKSSVGFSSYSMSSMATYVIVPQQSSNPYNLPAPQIQTGSYTYTIGQASTSARAAIQSMYAGGGSFRLVSQDAAVRRFHANVTAQCSTGSYNSSYPTQQQYNQNAAQSCPTGSTLSVQEITP